MEINRLEHAQEMSEKVARLYRRRAEVAHNQFVERLRKAGEQLDEKIPTDPLSALTDWAHYAVDAAQRTVLFWDALRQRGNNYLDHVEKGQPPVLHFDYETVVDGRHFAKPVNYALVRITPPAGVKIDAGKRPYMIVDPRAGHGPGIGGFKDDSQVGVALRAGHPVYFVIFFREPEPGQTLLDVCAAEQAFVRKVRELHPKSLKPAVIGNCQGGWAAMMLAASGPDDTGPVVINGAPMSYWGGAWQEGEGDNPMRYAGGLLGGSWLASLSADMGHGVFDGAYLVENFENLNPANTYWDKYYHVFANADTEPPRFLEFERWWGGFYLMNREEIEWITKNLFVGNKLWKGQTTSNAGAAFDLRNIKAPIVLFASMGDNITPPQQAFNWVADIYGSTEEIKSRGQVIVGLLHKSVGHLGIFVSGKVAKKEHAQIVEVLESIELLPPGLYGMEISERRDDAGKVTYDVEFQEHRLEDIVERLNRFQRQDEKPFEAVAQVSDFNQRAYEMFLRPLVQAMSTDASAKVMRELHPLRAQRWSVSDRNPWLWWLGPAAEAVRQARQPLAQDSAPRRQERYTADIVSATLDYYRGMRDAVSEAMFFQLYGNVLGSLAENAEQRSPAETAAPAAAFVEEALAAIGEGGFNEAFARIGALLARPGKMPLSRVALRKEIAVDYAGLLPQITAEAWRRMRGEQEIIVRHAPEQALAMLPRLVADEAERARLLRLVDRLVADPRMQANAPTADQADMLARIRAALAPAQAAPRLAAVKN
jgi:pimeloyl-ACP methyl ester carboxylesterase